MRFFFFVGVRERFSTSESKKEFRGRNTQKKIKNNSNFCKFFEILI